MLEEIPTDRDVSIYCLKDPRNGDIRYIGKTLSPLAVRLQGHCDDKANTRKSAWIKSLKKINLRPIINLLEVCVSGVSWEDCERKWIKHGKDIGWNLTNHTSGGDKFRVYDYESRSKISKALTGIKRSEETKQKVRVANIGKKHSMETILKRKLSLQGRVFSEEWMSKIRSANRVISDDKIIEIVNKFNARSDELIGVRVKELSVEYGVCSDTISKIIKGRYLSNGQGLKANKCITSGISVQW